MASGRRGSKALEPIWDKSAGNHVSGSISVSCKDVDHAVSENGRCL